MKALALAVALIAGSAAYAGDAPAQKFRWPLIGKASASPDGRGVEIAAPEGAAVHAAADGEVLYASDELASYGRMIVIRHAGDYVTTYAHLSAMAVAQGVKVKRGEIIGKSGKSGDAKTPALHFELRQGETSLAPIGYLGPR